ncbi:MAG: dethiobiotin synthase [Chitinophagaceae bacterium]
MKPIFVTGIGTGIGKTVISAILTEALQADYWKPVQAGFALGTDSLQVKSLVSHPKSRTWPETYKLSMPAAPHLAAQTEGKTINLNTIFEHYSSISKASNLLVIEGAGGLMVPLNDKEFMHDLISRLDARVIIVSRNYLGSINHSLLTSSACRSFGLDVIGWIFNDQYLDYEAEIAKWSGYPVLASIPHADQLNKDFILKQAAAVAPALKKWI